MASHSKRKASRADMEVKVTYRLADREYVAFSHDISRTGIFVKTQEVQAVGTKMPMVLNFANYREAVNLVGIVKRCVQIGERQEAGMGIQFLFGDEEQRASVYRLIDHMMVEHLGAQLYERLTDLHTSDTTASLKAYEGTMTTLSMESIDLDN
ncbi:MAG: PilZ domain-containing protein [Myxococcota bacterium]|nr:PilZ domain-containing protein [Myxococcota bacterium]